MIFCEICGDLFVSQSGLGRFRHWTSAAPLSDRPRPEGTPLFCVFFLLVVLLRCLSMVLLSLLRCDQRTFHLFVPVLSTRETQVLKPFVLDVPCLPSHWIICSHRLSRSISTHMRANFPLNVAWVVLSILIVLSMLPPAFLNQFILIIFDG